MEINGVLAAVKASSIKAYSKITICSDSQYCINGFSIWVHNWSKNGWKSGRKEIKNRDLWEEAFELLNNHQHDFEFKWIRGHQGHVWNELADKVAGEQSRKVMLSTT
jgi:ribonuclease HI